MAPGRWTLQLRVHSVCPGIDARAQTLMPKFLASRALTHLAPSTDARRVLSVFPATQEQIRVRRAKLARIL